MLKFIALFLLETKRFYAKKKLFFQVFLLILLMVPAYLGINLYNKTMAKAGEFRVIEYKMFSNLKNYSQLSIQGVRLKFVPSSAMVLFHDTGMSVETTARINPVITLSIYNNLKGKEVARNNYRGLWDYAGIFLIMGSLYALVLGIEVPRNKEYLKSLSTMLREKKIILHLSFSRCILMVFTYVFMFGVHLLFIKMMGIEFSPADWTGIFIYMVTSVVTVVFFLYLGVFLGFIRTPVKAFAALFLSWFLLIFILPGALNILVWEGFENKNSYNLIEKKQLDFVTDFEKKSYLKEGEFDRDRLEIFREMAESYYQNVFPKITALEKDYKGKLESRIRSHNKLSIFFPTTYYNMVSSEVSSRGNENFLRFYSYDVEMHVNFVRFWIDRVFYCDPKVMVSFIQNDENIYQGESIVPIYFSPGLFSSGIYIFLLSLGGLIRFKRFIYTYEDNKTPFKKKEPLSVISGEINTYNTVRTGIRDYLYNLFTGASLKTKPKEQNLDVMLDREVLTWGKKKDGFVYICLASEIPGDIDGRDFTCFVLRSNNVGSKEKSLVLEKLPRELAAKNFSQMSREEQVQILLEVLPYIKGKLFLFYHTCKDLTIDHYIFFKKQLKRLIKNGATVIYLSPETSVNEIKKERHCDILELPYWVHQVETMEEIN